MSKSEVWEIYIFLKIQLFFHPTHFDEWKNINTLRWERVKVIFFIIKNNILSGDHTSRNPIRMQILPKCLTWNLGTDLEHYLIYIPRITFYFLSLLVWKFYNVIFFCFWVGGFGATYGKFNQSFFLWYQGNFRLIQAYNMKFDSLSSSVQDLKYGWLLLFPFWGLVEILCAIREIFFVVSGIILI